MQAELPSFKCFLCCLTDCVSCWHHRKMPEPPEEMAELPVGGSKMSTAQLDAYNLKAFNTFETKSLNTCPYCSRTFK